MKEIAGSVEALFVLLGGFLFWPIARRVSSKRVALVAAFEWIFFLHLISVGGSLLLVVWVWMSGHPDWLHLMIIPYLFGFTTLFLAVVAIPVARLRGCHGLYAVCLPKE